MKNRNRGLRRAAAFVLAAVLAGSSVEIPTAAADGDTDTGNTGSRTAVITAFSDLGDGIRTQTLDAGAEEGDITLPETLTVTLETQPAESGVEAAAAVQDPDTQTEPETEEPVPDNMQTEENTGTQENPDVTQDQTEEPGTGQGTEENTEPVTPPATENTEQPETPVEEEPVTQPAETQVTEPVIQQQEEPAEPSGQEGQSAGTETPAAETGAAETAAVLQAEPPAEPETPVAEGQKDPETADAEQTVTDTSSDSGILTSLLDAVFPSMTVHAAEADSQTVTSINIAWKIDENQSSSGTFQSEKAAKYVYVPELPETVTIDGIDYTLELGESVQLPKITVTVAEKTDGYGTVIYEGTTGDCTWTLYDTDRDGTEDLLVIGGDTPEYYSGYLPPWYEYRENIKRVVVEEGVTGLGMYTFYYCTNLKDVSLPSTLVIIREGAFCGCESLSSLVIPSGVTEIGIGAFEDCSSLVSITLPDTLKSIEYNAFFECGLVEIEIPEGVETIGRGAFCQCYSLQSVILPDTLKSIGEDAFYLDSNLTIIVPESVQTIGSSAFSKAKAVYNLSDCTVTGSNIFKKVNYDKITLVKNGVSSEQRVLPADCVAGSRYAGTRYDSSYYYSSGEGNTAWYVQNGDTYEKVTSGTSFQNTPTFYYAKAFDDATVEAEAAGESGDSYTLTVKDKETGDTLEEGTHYTQEMTDSTDWAEMDTGSLAKTVTVTITGIAGGGYVGTMQTTFQISAEAEASVTADGSTKKYPAFEDAWKAAQGKTAEITLLADVEVSEVFTVQEGSDITLKSDPDHAEYTLFSNANETNGGLINVTGGTFTLVSGIVRNGENGSNAIAVSGGGKFIMNGGSAVAQADGHSGICVYSGGTAEINGGSASGYNGLAIVDGGSGTIYGGTFKGTFGTGSAAVLLRNVGSTTLKDILKPKSGRAYYNGTEVTAENLITELGGKSLTGTVTVDECKHSYNTWTEKEDGENHIGTCVVCGHEETKPHDWDTDGSCKAEGCAAQAVASVTGNDGKTAYYPTIEEAWQAAKNMTGTATVTLLADAVVTSSLTVEDNEEIIFTGKSEDGAVHTLSSDMLYYQGVIAVNGGSLLLLDGNIRACSGGYGLNVKGGSFIMKGGSIVGTYWALVAEAGSVTIDGGTIDAGIGYGLMVYKDAPVTVTLSGGTYIGGSEGNYAVGGSGSVETYLANGYAYKQGGTWVNDTTVTELIGTVTVEKAPIESVSVTADKTSLVYGDTAPALTATVTQPDGSTNDVTYQWYLDDEEIAGATGDTYTPDKLDAGEYTYTCTATVDGYSLPGTVATVTVNRADIENAVVTLTGTSFEYIGGTLEIGVQSVVLNDTKLNWGTDYTYSGQTGQDADTYTVKVEGKGNYTGIATATWEIYQKELTVNNWTIEKVYDGTTDVTLNGADAVLYGVCYQDDVKLDASGVTAQFADAAVGGNKTVTYTGSFALTGETAKNYVLKYQPILIGTITKRPVSVTPDNLTKEYGADDPKLTYQLTSGSLLAGHTLTLGRAEGESEGSYAINTFTIVDEDGNDVAGNYDVTLEAVDFQITRSDLGIATVTLEQDSFIYDGTEHKPTVTVVKNGNTLAEGTDYTVTYEKNMDAGTASATITAVENGNYYGTQTVEFKIEKATPNLGTVGYIGTIYPDTALTDIVLTRTDDTVPGTLALKEGQTLTAGTGEYDWTFIPQDTDNYNEVTGTVTLEVVIDPNATAYTITIPATAVAGGDAVSVGINTKEPFNLNGGTVSVSVSDGIDENGKLTLTNTDGSGSSVTSAMYVGEKPITSFTDQIFAVFESPDDSPVSLFFKEPTETDILAGTYEGTVTFSIDYTAAEGGTTE